MTKLQNYIIKKIHLLIDELTLNRDEDLLYDIVLLTQDLIEDLKDEENAK